MKIFFNINDPLGQTYSLASSSERCFGLKFVMFCYILKSADVRVRTYGQHVRKS